MSGHPPEDLTVLIDSAAGGDRASADRLFEVVYDKLRAIARRNHGAGRHGHTLQPTVLANEAYLVLAERLDLGDNTSLPCRAMFFRTVALAMRSILRDYWRKQHTLKRGQGTPPAPLTGVEPATPVGELDTVDYLALDEALDGLQQYNRRWHEVVMHRYFAGCSVDDTARMLSISASTVKADWKLAHVWLRRELGAEPE